jgi:hypothetical protein
LIADAEVELAAARSLIAFDGEAVVKPQRPNRQVETDADADIPCEARSVEIMLILLSCKLSFIAL